MSFGSFGRELRETVLSLAPALLLIVSFQVLVLRQPWSEFWPIALGLVATVIGFVLFIEGAKLGLLPLGRSIGNAFIERRALVPLLTFGLLLGIVLTVAEPDVRLLAYQMEGVLEGFTTRSTLIFVTAMGLGVFGVVALLRNVMAFGVRWILVPGYLLAAVLLLFVPESAATMAYDMGAVTTGPMTVPFLLALGVGLASVLGGRDQLQSGFGVMAIGSVGPILAILVWQLWVGGS